MLSVVEKTIFCMVSVVEGAVMSIRAVPPTRTKRAFTSVAMLIRCPEMCSESSTSAAGSKLPDAKVCADGSVTRKEVPDSVRAEAG